MRSLCLALLIVGACGSGDPDTPDAGTGRYLPLAVGNTWSYRVTPSAGTPVMKTTTVEAMEAVPTRPSVTAFRVRTEKTDGSTTTWQEDTGDMVVRHYDREFDLTQTMTYEASYDPFKIRIDETSAHTAMGAMFNETFTENPTGGTALVKNEAWTVDAVAEQVTVPAGTFTCIRLHRVGTDVGASDKTYWYARGVGKVKEVGGQLEELASYDTGTGTGSGSGTGDDAGPQLDSLPSDGW